MVELTKNKRLFICGDFNIDLIKTDSSQESKSFSEMMNSPAMFPLINKPTRITTRTATLIDNIFTNEIKYTVDSGIIIDDLSDHLPIFALCDFEVERNNISMHHEGNHITDTNLEALKLKLKQHDWSNVHTSNDVNTSYNYFINDFKAMLEQTCTRKKKKKSTKNKESINLL